MPSSPHHRSHALTTLVALTLASLLLLTPTLPHATRHASPPHNAFVEWAPAPLCAADPAACSVPPPHVPPAAAGVRYLVLVGPIGPSHSYVLRRVGVELASRGAHVLAVAPAAVDVAPVTDAATAARWRAVSFQGVGALARAASVMASQPWREAHMSLMMGALADATAAECDALVADAGVAAAIAAFEPHFLVGDTVDSCTVVMSERLGVPRAEVGVGSLVPGMHASWRRGWGRDWPLAADVLAVPATGTAMVPPLASPVVALLNAAAHGMEAVLDVIFVRRAVRMLHARHGVDAASRGARARAALLIANADPAWEYTRTLPPGVLLPGSIMAGPGDPLPADLAAWTASAAARGDRVIYAALGSFFRLLPDQAAALVSGLSTLPRVSVVIRLTADEMDDATVAGQPANVRVVRWAPQNDLLASGTVDLFVTHGGASSIGEAVYHGVPLVVMPQGAEQRDNAVKVAAAGFGVPVLRFRAPPPLIINATAAALADLDTLTARARSAQARARVGRSTGAATAAAAIERAALLGLGARQPLPGEVDGGVRGRLVVGVVLVVAGTCWGGVTKRRVE